MEKISCELFEKRITRLKALLGLYEDKEAAGALGITKAAISARKARGAFPEKELLLLAAQKGFDADWVMNGGVVKVFNMPATGEEALLQRFRAMDVATRNKLIDIADVLMRGSQQ